MPVVALVRNASFASLACLALASRAPGQESMVTILSSLGSPATYSHGFNSVNTVYSQSFATGASLPAWGDVDGNGVPLFFIRGNFDVGRIFGYDPEIDDMGMVPAQTYYEMRLRADGGGMPGAILWNSGLFAIDAAGEHLLAVHDQAPVLQPSTTYWLTLTFRGGQISDPPALFATSPAPAGGYATFGSLYLGDHPDTWFAREGAALLSIEFEGTPVPEASALPLALGALALGLLARRRRDKSRAGL